MWVGNRAAVQGVHVGRVSTWGERARLSVVAEYVCTVAHTCSIRTDAVVSNYSARILMVYSALYALGNRYCTGTRVKSSL